MVMYGYIYIYTLCIYTIAMGKSQPVGTFWRMDGWTNGQLDGWKLYKPSTWIVVYRHDRLYKKRYYVVHLHVLDRMGVCGGKESF
jgi:hypothetical protein